MITLFACVGGALVLPDKGRALLSREDGGNLVVDPPRAVWERCELSPSELSRWGFLVAAAGAAMIESLPQLKDGCVNYWEAGNWALHDDAPPVGRKTARESRRVHLHLLGRSPAARDPDWRWGEAPVFPRFGERAARLAAYERLSAAEASAIVDRTEELLRARYGYAPDEIAPRSRCASCAYPFARGQTLDARMCGECN